VRRMELGTAGHAAIDRRTAEALASELLADVAIPQPWDRDELARRLTTRFGKPIRILPLSEKVELQELLVAGISGTIIASASSITIYFDDSGSEIHQQNIIFHELGHYLLGDVTEDQIMCRTDFGEVRETNAELFARTMVLEVRRHDTLQRAPHTDDHPGVQRLGGALADAD